jgi:hypothetical protein
MYHPERVAHPIGRIATLARISLGALCAAVLLAACARDVRVESSWKDRQAEGQPFAKILVVGVSPDPGLRCDFESFMVTQLRSDTVEAKASCYFIPTSEALTREAVERAVAEYGADAVLTTSLIHSAATAEEGTGNDSRGQSMYKATGAGYGAGYYGPGYFGGYGAYGVPVVYVKYQEVPPVTVVEGKVTIDSMVYSASDAALIYELETKAHDLHSRDNALATLTAPIAERLRRDQVIR